MQTITYEHLMSKKPTSLKTKNQISLRHRDSIHHRAIWAAVQEWEATLPGQSQDRIVQLVAEVWEKEGGRGLTVNKQNLYRYLKNENNSGKYTAYVMQLAHAISWAMPIEIARKHGLRQGKTDAELVASAILECTEAHQAKLLGAPLQKLEKEIREAAIALFSLLPSDTAGPLLASIGAVAPQFL